MGESLKNIQAPLSKLKGRHRGPPQPAASQLSRSIYGLQAGAGCVAIRALPGSPEAPSSAMLVNIQPINLEEGGAVAKGQCLVAV